MLTLGCRVTDKARPRGYEQTGARRRPGITNCLREYKRVLMLSCRNQLFQLDTGTAITAMPNTVHKGRDLRYFMPSSTSLQHAGLKLGVSASRRECAKVAINT